ncbi:ParB/RepB/Spo0J family partition protein [Bordetella bronchiseptica]|uniref:ParB/RepB/Spo0J family partition protein n=1 Tax=Bordetella bronchiseptica TaxID=518 RepID=UPI0004616AA4|nr:ParB/RepB/Spo0J family partition protein [Bordetella bronchiseptica]KDD49420.1 ParB-like protein [Bordetella bronchiseptica MBORD901]
MPPDTMIAVPAKTPKPAEREVSEENPREYREALRPRDEIVPSKTNPRKRFGQEALQELAGSLRKHGILQPILCREHPTEAGKLELIAGERRWRAAGLAKLTHIPVRIIVVDDLEMLELQVIENLQRQDLHPIEEAESYEALLAANKDNANYGVNEMAARLKKSRAYIYARLKLCDLEPEARTAFYEDKLTASVALLVARIPVRELQLKALHEVTTGETEEYYSDDEGPMSARRAAEHIQENYMLELKRAVFPIAQADLVTTAGSCVSCIKRTGAQPELFSDVESADVCTDPTCFDQKKKAHLGKLAEAAEQTGQKVIRGEKAEKIFPYEHSSPRGYIKPDQHSWQHSTDGKTYAEVLGDDMPPAVMVENPHSGELISMVPEKDVLKALADKGIKSSQDEQRERIKKEEAKIKFERDSRRGTLESIHEAVSQRIHAGEILQHEDLLMIAQASMSRLWNDHRPTVCRLWGWDPKDHQEVRAGVDGLSPGQLALLLMEIAIAPELAVNAYSANEPTYLIATAKRYGVDPEASKNGLRAATREKNKAKAKPTRKPDESKGAAKATPTATRSDTAKKPATKRKVAPKGDCTTSDQLSADVSAAPESPQPTSSAKKPTRAKGASKLASTASGRSEASKFATATSTEDDGQTPTNGSDSHWPYPTANSVARQGA